MKQPKNYDPIKAKKIRSAIFSSLLQEIGTELALLYFANGYTQQKVTLAELKWELDQLF